MSPVYSLRNSNGMLEAADTVSGRTSIRLFHSYETASETLSAALKAGSIKPEQNVYIVRTSVPEAVQALKAGRQIALDKERMESLRQEFLEHGIRFPPVESFVHPHIMIRLPPESVEKSGS